MKACAIQTDQHRENERTEIFGAKRKGRNIGRRDRHGLEFAAWRRQAELRAELQVRVVVSPLAAHRGRTGGYADRCGGLASQSDGFGRAVPEYQLERCHFESRQRYLSPRLDDEVQAQERPQQGFGLWNRRQDEEPGATLGHLANLRFAKEVFDVLLTPRRSDLLDQAIRLGDGGVLLPRSQREQEILGNASPCLSAIHPAA